MSDPDRVQELAEYLYQRDRPSSFDDDFDDAIGPLNYIERAKSLVACGARLVDGKLVAPNPPT